MDWSKGFSARYYGKIVDPKSWRDTTPVDVISGSINRTEDDLVESADIDCENFDIQEEKWIRIYLDARQEDEGWHGPLFTGIVSSPSIQIEGTTKSNSLQCYSVLKPAQDVLLPRGWYIYSGDDGGKVVYDLLKDVIPAPIDLDVGRPNITSTIVAEDGESVLSMASTILYSMGWRFRISGDGRVRICPNANTLYSSFGESENDSIETTVKIDYNWYNCPNVFRAVSDDLSAVAKDENPNSQLSINRRGREIWMEETNCALLDGESLADYAARRLKEEQAVLYTLNYNRRFDPEVTIGDIIRLNYPAQGIGGYFKVSNQTITLGYGATVAETVQGYSGVVYDENGAQAQYGPLFIPYDNDYVSIILPNGDTLYMKE